MPFRFLGDLLASRRLEAGLAFKFPAYLANATYEIGDVASDPVSGDLYVVTAPIAGSTDLVTDAASVRKLDTSAEATDNGDGTFTVTNPDGTTVTVDTRASASLFDGAGSGAADAGVAAATTVEGAIQALDAAVDAANDATGVAVDPTNFDGAQNAVLSATDGDIQTALDTIDEVLRDFGPADGTNAGTQGLVPAPPADANTKILRGDGTWIAMTAAGNTSVVTDNADGTYSHADGQGTTVVVDTKASSNPTDTTNFGGALSAADDTVQKALDTLDDASPAVISDFATSPDAGLAPAKADASDDTKFLRGDGTWQAAAAPDLDTRIVNFATADWVVSGPFTSALTIPAATHAFGAKTLVDWGRLYDASVGQWVQSLPSPHTAGGDIIFEGGGMAFDGWVYLSASDLAGSVTV